MARPKKPERPDYTQKQKDELDLRKYIRRSGGYRKELSPAGKKNAQGLLKKLKRNVKDGWDATILPAGYSRYPIHS